MDRNETIRRIKAALKSRSLRRWSVRGGQGTAWGWIEICAMPSRMNGSSMTDDDRVELGRVLGLDEAAHHQGVSIPAGSDYRREYVDRAEGRTPTVVGKAYWD